MNMNSVKAICAVGTLLLTAASANAGIMLASKGGVEVWSEPQMAPAAGFVATKIFLHKFPFMSVK